MPIQNPDKMLDGSEVRDRCKNLNTLKSAFFIS